jgi:bloom syndrome protein
MNIAPIDIAKLLREKHKIKCDNYLAGFEACPRRVSKKKWHRGVVKVVCATIAFDMRIDKPDMVCIFRRCVSIYFFSLFVSLNI